MAEKPKQTNPFATIGGIIGAAFGWGVSQYAGPTLWIPGAATLLLLFLFVKTPLRPKYFVGAITVTTGHVFWFLVGSFAGGYWTITIPDIVALSIGVLWLWIRPNLAAVLFLGFVQLISLVINIYTLSSSAVGSLSHKALTIHSIWRVMALSALVVGYLKFRRESAAVLPPPFPDTVQEARTE